MADHLKILILEDSDTDADIVQRILQKQMADCSFRLAMDKEAYFHALDEFKPDIILSDHSLPQFNSTDALVSARKRYPDIPFIMVTGSVSEEFAADIIKTGADDFLLKDRLKRLPAAIDAAIKNRRAQKEKLEVLERLVKSEERYRTLFERNHAGVYQTTIEGVILSCNYAYAKMLGYESQAELQENDHALQIYFSKLDNEKFVAALRQQGQLTNHERILRHKEGRVVHVLENASITTEPETGEEIIEGVILDITLQKRSVEERQRLSSIIEATSDFVSIADNNRRTVFINKAGREMTGYDDAENLSAKMIDDFMPSWTNQKLIADIIPTAIKNDKWHGELALLHKDGTEIPVSAVVIVLDAPDGNPEFIATIARDISELKNAEKQRLFDSNNLSALINNTDDQMWSVDKAFRLITSNNAFNEMASSGTGKMVKKVSNILVSDFHGQHIERFKRFYERAFTGESFTEILRTGESWAEISFYPIYSGPDIVGTACFSRNITERKKAEKILKSLEQEILNQKVQEQKSVTIAILNAQERERNHMGQELHDNINQLLAATKMHLEIISRKYEDIKPLIQYPKELVTKSIEEIRKLSSTQVTPSKNINLQELVQKIITGLNESTSIKTDFVFDVPDKMISDDLKLNIYRIIQEQINNIIKHAAPQNICVSIKVSGPDLRLLIEDDGKGFNLAKERKGIGLSNIVNRVESFNGKVKIKSSLGKGCKVEITIPC